MGILVDGGRRIEMKKAAAGKSVVAKRPVPSKNVAANSSGPLSGQDHGVRVGDDVLKQRTGKIWAEWFPILDKAGAKKMNHSQITDVLQKKFDVPDWWCQMVAVGYEHSRGLRELHESCAGFSASVSRTFGLALKPLFAACADDKKRRAWLSEDKLVVSTARPEKTVRGAWDGASRLEMRFYPKGAAKTQVVIDHMKLTSSADVEKMKAFWSENLERLREFAER
jgi:hypothetical protein